MASRMMEVALPGVAEWCFQGDVSADERLVEARHRLEEWVHGYPGGAAVAADVALGCWEAVANARDHGYRDGRGPVEVRAWVRDGVLTVTVCDDGLWQPPGVRTGRGRGLQLIQALADAVDMISYESGTRVVMSWRLGPTPAFPRAWEGDPHL